MLRKWKTFYADLPELGNSSTNKPSLGDRYNHVTKHPCILDQFWNSDATAKIFFPLRKAIYREKEVGSELITVSLILRRYYLTVINLG